MKDVRLGKKREEICDLYFFVAKPARKTENSILSYTDADSHSSFCKPYEFLAQIPHI